MGDWQRPPSRCQTARFTWAETWSGFAGGGSRRGFSTIPFRLAWRSRRRSRPASRISSSLAPGYSVHLRARPPRARAVRTAPSPRPSPPLRGGEGEMLSTRGERAPSPRPSPRPAPPRYAPRGRGSSTASAALSRRSQLRRPVSGPSRVHLVVELLQHRPGLLAVDAGVGVEGLGPELVVERLADDVEDRLLRGAHGPLGVPQDLPRDELGLLHQLVVRHHLHDEVALQGPLHVDRLGGQDELHRDADAAGVDEPDDPAVAVVEA